MSGTRNADTKPQLCHERAAQLHQLSHLRGERESVWKCLRQCSLRHCLWQWRFHLRNPLGPANLEARLVLPDIPLPTPECLWVVGLAAALVRAITLLWIAMHVSPHRGAMPCTSAFLAAFGPKRNLPASVSSAVRLAALQSRSRRHLAIPAQTMCSKKIKTVGAPKRRDSGGATATYLGTKWNNGEA